MDTLLEGRSKHRYVCRDVRDGVKGRLAHGKMFSLRTVVINLGAVYLTKVGSGLLPLNFLVDEDIGALSALNIKEILSRSDKAGTRIRRKCVVYCELQTEEQKE